MGVSEAAREAGVDQAAVIDWKIRYEAEGSFGLIVADQNREYSDATKLEAVEEYCGLNNPYRPILKKTLISSCIIPRLFLYPIISCTNMIKGMDGAWRSPA